MITNSYTFRAVRFILVIAMLATAGCQSPWKTPKFLSLDNTWPFRDKDQAQQGTPVRMVGAWTDTVFTQPGQKPQRGFGGRILFYDKEGKKPILVDGQLVVYAFDEANRDPTDNKPTRRYVFPADQMPLHMSKSDLGASYSFWLPWDDAGGVKTEVSLICRFEPKGGAVVTGEQTKHILPGPVSPATATSGAKQPPRVPEGVPSKPAKQTLENLQSSHTADRRAQLANYEAPASGDPSNAVVNAAAVSQVQPERRLTATTISLPQNYQLPDVAALNNAAWNASVPMATAPQGPMQVPQQYSPNQGQLLLPATPTRTYTMPHNPGAQQLQQPPSNLPPQRVPGRPPITATQGNWNNMAMSPMAQQQFQQPLVQQMMQQQLMQQQQQLMQQPVGAQQTLQQMPMQAMQTGAVNYQAPGQVPR